MNVWNTLCLYIFPTFCHKFFFEVFIFLALFRLCVRSSSNQVEKYCFKVYLLYLALKTNLRKLLYCFFSVKTEVCIFYQPKWIISHSLKSSFLRSTQTDLVVLIFFIVVVNSFILSNLRKCTPNSCTIYTVTSAPSQFQWG